MNLFASGVSPNRIAAALAVAAILSPSVAAADPFLTSPPPWTGEITPPPVIGAAGEAMERIDGASKTDIIRGIFLDQLNEGRWTGHGGGERVSTSPASNSVTVADDGCFDEDIPDLDADVRERMRQASLFLVVTRTLPDGTRTSATGTGTVIEADVGDNKVLTASHVAGSLMAHEGRVGSLESVHAFDAEGRLVAKLAPSYDYSRVLFLGDQELVHDEAMVLSPIWFPSREIAEGWNGRGLEVAPAQGSNLQFFTPENEASPVGSGYSGAALVNAEGMVIGIYSENADYGKAMGRPGEIAENSPMPEAILRHSLYSVDAPARMAVESIASRDPYGVSMSVVAVGPPLASASVLTALGVDPNRIDFVDTLGEMRVFSAGYPSFECRLNAFDLKDIDTAPYAENPDLHAILLVGEPEIPTLPNFFAGMEALSTPSGPAPFPEGLTRPSSAPNAAQAQVPFDPFEVDMPESVADIEGDRLPEPTW
jgi:hypothetical protein